jgi:putative FmdB family regulatory protein
MPIYEYRCNSCNIQFELRQKFSDPPAEKCPKCGGTVHKLVSAASFSLKGGGWYGDGYGAKVESTNSEGVNAAIAGAGAAEAEATTAGAPAETTVSPATQSTAPTQVETKSKVAETPKTTEDKTEVKSQGKRTSIP